MKTIIGICMLISASLLIQACSDSVKSPEDEILQFIESGVQAGEDRSADDLSELIHPDYADQNGYNRKQLGKLLRAYFFRHKSIHLFTRIDEIELLEAAGARLVFRVRCSKGTYIRSLVEDIARVAGTVGHTSRLHRENVGDFLAEDMLDLKGAEAVAADGPGPLREQLLPADRALARMPDVSLESALAEKFCGGQAVPGGATGQSGLTRVYGERREFLGVGELSGDGMIAPRRVFRVARG